MVARKKIHLSLGRKGQCSTTPFPVIPAVGDDNTKNTCRSVIPDALFLYRGKRKVFERWDVRVVVPGMSGQPCEEFKILGRPGLKG